MRARRHCGCLGIPDDKPCRFHPAALWTVRRLVHGGKGNTALVGGEVLGSIRGDQAGAMAAAVGMYGAPVRLLLAE